MADRLLYMEIVKWIIARELFNFIATNCRLLEIESS